MGEIKFVGGLLMVSLFSISLILFAVGFADENNAAFNLGDSDQFSKTRQALAGNLSKFHIEVINSSDSFYKSEIQEGETVKTGGQFKLGPATVLTTTKTVTSQGFRSVFGSDGQFAFILTALLGFLGFVLFLLIWKTWGGRNPE